MRNYVLIVPVLAWKGFCNIYTPSTLRFLFLPLQLCDFAVINEMVFACPDEHCPQILAAARTLCDMATCSSRQNPDGIMRWPKKPSQKAMKARKLKSIEKPEEAYGTSVVVSGSDNLRRSVDRMMLPPKKPRLSMVDDRKDFNNFSCVTKGPINWSTPRSSRSSPGKSLKESIVDIRDSTTDVVRQSYMMPPPARVPEKASNKREKIRKLLTMEWNRGRDRLD